MATGADTQQRPVTAQFAGAERPLLEVRGLNVSFGEGDDRVEVISSLSYTLDAGRTLGVVGESGCGKTMTALSLLGLIPFGGRMEGSIRLGGRELIGQSKAEWRRTRGGRVAMIFQEPMTALNPVMPVGRQIGEVLEWHFGMNRNAALAEAVGLLEAVGIPAARQRAKDYPHQLSGGMRQRAMIAMALACKPNLLVADEPTTALDVTIQAQIIDLMVQLQDEVGMAIQFISHNLAVISEIADDIVVMYAGRGIEYTNAERLFENPLHPYTQGLINTLPDPENRKDRLPVIKGRVPSARDFVGMGCRFADRCPKAIDACRADDPEIREVEPGHWVACIRVFE